jgi:hypothetical protein
VVSGVRAGPQGRRRRRCGVAFRLKRWLRTLARRVPRPRARHYWQPCGPILVAENPSGWSHDGGRRQQTQAGPYRRPSRILVGCEHGAAPQFPPLRWVTVMGYYLPSPCTGSWTGAQGNPSAASAISAVIRAVCAASTFGARGRTSCKRQASGSNLLTGSRSEGLAPRLHPARGTPMTT